MTTVDISFISQEGYVPFLPMPARVVPGTMASHDACGQSPLHSACDGELQGGGGLSRRDTPLSRSLQRLEPGSKFDYREADALVNDSQGRLVWAKDGEDKWWIVRREDRKDVEKAKCGYEGPGLQYGSGDCARSEQEADIDGIQYLRGAQRSLAGPWAGARVDLRPGQACSQHKAQSIIDQSGGQLAWAQDGKGDWWAVMRGQREDVEQAHQCGQAYGGHGLRMMDQQLRGSPVSEGGIDWLNAATTPFVGCEEHAQFQLRPGIDQWSLGSGRRLAESSQGCLSVIQDRMGNSYLIDVRKLDNFDPSGQQCPHECVRLPWGGGDRSRDYGVRSPELEWINAAMAMRWSSVTSITSNL